MRDRVFRHKALKDFDTKYVAVRLLGGLDTTDETQDAWRRYQVESFPQNLILTKHGALLKKWTSSGCRTRVAADHGAGTRGSRGVRAQARQGPG